MACALNRESPKAETKVWNLDRVDQRSNSPDGRYSVNLDGTGVHVYVLDSGIQFGHFDFGGRAVPAIETHQGKVKECNGDKTCSYDLNGHGTHCAGTVGGSTYGAARV